MVKVRREKIEGCMACPICKKILREATTVSECLHTFCRKCIVKVITEDDVDCCPVCDINLGCTPLDKLRADHSLQDLCAKLFPSNNIKAKATESESVPSVTLLTRRKERSLSSLEMNTPIIEAQIDGTGTGTGKEKKSVARKGLASRELTFRGEEVAKQIEDCAGGSSSLETVNNIAQNIVKEAKNLTISDFSKQHMPSKGENSIQPCPWEANTWQPWKYSIDTSIKTKYSSPNSTVNLPTPQFQSGEPCVFKPKLKETDENGQTQLPKITQRKPRGARKKIEPTTEVKVSNNEARMVVETSRECLQAVSSIWFSLVASNQQKVFPHLAQVPSRYLRIKDGNIPVLFIKKYLVKKLDLISEAEVEITLRGQPLESTWKMHELVDLWLHTAPTSQRIQTTVGSSAKDVVMVLLYSRKVQLP